MSVILWPSFSNMIFGLVGRGSIGAVISGSVVGGFTKAIRGDNSNDDSNFIQAIKFRAKGIPELPDRMERRENEIYDPRKSNY